MQQRILFVDDEPLVLAALRRTMGRFGREWSVDLAHGCSEAMERVGSEEYDVVVSDMRMPDGTGMDLLTQVQSASPDTARLILTGFSSGGLVHAYGGVVHQFLSKPWEPRGLVKIIDRVMRVRQMLADPRFRRAAGELDRLPSVPRVLTELTSLLEGEGSSASDISDVIRRDPGMSARVLQLVNSAFFGLPRQISDISQAVVYLGASTLRSLLFNIAVFEAFQPAAGLAHFSIDDLQSRSLLTARLATRMLEDRDEREKAFSGGLLRFVGQLIMASRLPELFESALEKTAEKPLHLAEREVMNITHAEMGAYLLGLWGLPESVVEAVANQYEPRPPEDRAFDAIDAVHLASSFVDPLIRGDSIVEPADAWTNELGIGGQLTGWEQLAFEMVEPHAESPVG